MLLRITRIDHDGTTVLRVEGRLSSTFVGELAKECEALHLAAALDLSNLCCVDAAGAAMLVKLASKGVEMREVSPYITMRMQQYALPSSSPHTSVA